MSKTVGGICMVTEFFRTLERRKRFLIGAVISTIAVQSQLFASDCMEAELPLQNKESFNLGETFYLPKQVKFDNSCSGTLAWSLSQVPGGSTNKVYMNGAPQPRFTPDIPGTYVFRNNLDQNQTVTLQVVQKTASDRFQNHYLPPYQGIAMVNGEIWSANGQSYTITRLVKSAQNNWIKAGEIPVGSWPGAVAWQQGLDVALVAMRGSDSLGFIRTKDFVQEDALWVGDEPTEIALTKDGRFAYVSLPNTRQVAKVNVANRTVESYISVGFDPRAIELSDDDAHLFVASYRSGDRNADARGVYGPEDDIDLWIIDTTSNTTVKKVSQLFAVNRSLHFDATTKKLYLVGTLGEPEISQADYSPKDGIIPFNHQILEINGDPTLDSFGVLSRRMSLANQPSSKGFFVSPSGIASRDGLIWVTSVSSNTVIALDAFSLEEKIRVPVGKGPRDIDILDNGEIIVHCYQSLELYRLSNKGDILQVVSLTDDPRPAPIALGESIFYSPGNAYAKEHACDSCHIEGQNEGMVWRFGAGVWANVRPIQLMAATPPQHWTGYVSTSSTDAYAAPASIVVNPLSPDEAAGMEAFLESLIGAPRANSHTRLDGSFSEAAKRGEQVFLRAGCVGCHTPPLYTNQRQVMGKTGMIADVPSLLGIYRHGVYLVDGRARSLEQAVEEIKTVFNLSLSDNDSSDLVRFLKELTPKGAAPGRMFPDIMENQSVYPEVRPYVEFFESIDGDSATQQQLATQSVKLRDSNGNDVAGQVAINGKRLTFIPNQKLMLGASYVFMVEKGLRFENGGILPASKFKRFTVAENPLQELYSEMTMSMAIQVGPVTQDANFTLSDITLEDAGFGFTMIPLNAGTQQREKLWLRIDGDRFTMRPFALPLSRFSPKWGPTQAVGNATDVVGEILERDVQGRPTLIKGTLRFTTPDLEIPLPFEIKP